MKIALACFTAVALCACATTPTANQVAAITNACAIDAGLRPTVTLLMAVPGLATPPESAAIVAARAIIDPICANPSATPQANTLTLLTSASAQVIGIVTTLQARKAK